MPNCCSWSVTLVRMSPASMCPLHSPVALAVNTAAACAVAAPLPPPPITRDRRRNVGTRPQGPGRLRQQVRLRPTKSARSDQHRSCSRSRPFPFRIAYRARRSPPRTRQASGRIAHDRVRLGSPISSALDTRRSAIPPYGLTLLVVSRSPGRSR